MSAWIAPCGMRQEATPLALAAHTRRLHATDDKGPFSGRQDVLLSYAPPEKGGPRNAGSENAGKTHNRR
jgi:hypothetical protein